MTLLYESSDGSVINLMSNGIYAQNPETLLKSSWSFTAVSGVNNIGKIKRFYKDAQQSPLLLSIMADNKEQFNAIMDKLHRTFEKDVRKLQPGKLWWNDFYKRVFVFEQSHDEFEEYFEAVEKTINVVSERSFWIKETKFQYFREAESTGTLDFPYDFMFDYGKSDLIEIIKNDCIVSSNFIMTFYGSCVNPTVYIGTHKYSLDISLSYGEYAVINSIDKTITKYLIDGRTENVFSSRNREFYIFEKIPEGNIPVLRAKDLSFDLTLIDERGEPEWI